jgi:hypothetical protein
MIAINLVTSDVLYVKFTIQLSTLMGNEGNNDKNDSYLASSSPTLVTRYAHKSSRLIYSIEKNIFIVIGVVAALAAISVIDTFERLGISDFIDESLDDTLIAILSVISLASLIPILRLSLQSKKTLEEWANMFERNSIKNSISMSLTSLAMEEVVYVVAETVEEIGDPLSQYIEKGDFPEFFNVAVGEHVFDVLIDSETIKTDKGTDLRRILDDYGPIIIKIINGGISKEEIISFSDSLSSYAMYRHRKRNTIGLAMIVGREVSPEAYTAAKSGKALINDILLIEKP